MFFVKGTNNAFQTKTESPLAILYSTSTMEHHHFDQCVMILNSDSNNIFQTLSMEDYRRVMRVVESAILSTDLAVYFKKKSRFKELIEDGEFDWQSEEKKEREFLIFSMYHKLINTHVPQSTYGKLRF